MNPEEKIPWQAIWKEEAARREERTTAADVERTDKRIQSLTPPLMTDEIRASEAVSQSHDVEILKPEAPPPDRYSEVVWTFPQLPSEYPRPYLPKPVVRRHRRMMRC